MSFISGQLELTLGDTESLSVSTFEGALSLSASDGLPDDYATIMANSVTSLVINGGSGDNFIDLMAVASDTFPNLAEVSVNGGDGADQIFGSEFSDSVFGGAGDDWIYAAQGDDSIMGDDGADSLFGGAGFDTIAAGDGSDSLNGQSGVDCLSGETGNDTIIGGGQVDLLSGGEGIDAFADLPGIAASDESLWWHADTLIGETAIDWLEAVPDTDVPPISEAPNTPLSDNGDDSLIGGQQADLPHGIDEYDTYTAMMAEMSSSLAPTLDASRETSLSTTTASPNADSLTTAAPTTTAMVIDYGFFVSSPIVVAGTSIPALAASADGTPHTDSVAAIYSTTPVMSSPAPVGPTNNPPSFFSGPTNFADVEGQTRRFSIFATDGDTPASAATPTQGLTRTVSGLPPGVIMEPRPFQGGYYRWDIHPNNTADRLPLTTAGVYPVTITVTDNGTPAKSATHSFTWTIRDLALNISAVSFIDGREVSPDPGAPTGTEYAAPHWQQSNNDRDPYIYWKGRNIAANLDFGATAASQRTQSIPIAIRAVTASGIAHAAFTYDLYVSRTTMSPGNYPLGNYAVSGFFNTTFDWQFSVDGVAWQPAGTTGHEFYVTYKVPTEPGAPIRTPLHVGTVAAAAAANAANATNVTVFAAIWDKFATRNVTRWRDGVRLKYYGGNTTATTLVDLLASPDGNGQCNSWAEFLIATASIQGIAGTQRIEITATGSQTYNGSQYSFNGFAVKNTALPTGPVPENTLARSTSGLVGQGGTLPSQYRFGRHYVVAFNNKYFDPSYGGNAGNVSEAQWESLGVAYLTFDRNGTPFAAPFTNVNQITFVVKP